MKIICDPGLLIGTLLQMFFCEFYEIFKATFLTDDCRNNLRCSTKYVFLKISQKSKENICAEVYYLITL